MSRNEEATGPATRRRGAALEAALLDAALEQLIAGGYGEFTIEAVAERAGTSRHVIYRRWRTREELAIAAFVHDANSVDRTIPDTGSLRDDMIALLNFANDTRREMVAVFSVQLGTYFQETGTTPAELRLRILEGRMTSIDTVLRRAIERGEIDEARLTPRIASVAIDLFRHEVMMTLKRVPAETIIEIVDDIFMPLVLRR